MRKGISPAVSFVLVALIATSAAIGLYFWLTSANAPTLEYVSITVSAYPYNSTTLVIVNAEARNSSSYTHLNTTVGRCDFGDAADCNDDIELQPGVPTRCYLRNADCSANVVGSGTMAVYGVGINTVYVDM
jgi:hypothetical protein